MSAEIDSRIIGLALAAGVVASAPAVWWVAGLLPDDDVGPEPDHAITPPDIGSTAELAIGLAAVVIVAAAAVALDRGTRSGVLARGWAQVASAAALAAGYVGLTYRVGTEPVSGANIGFGMLMLAAIPLFGILAVWAVLGLRSSHR